MTIQKGEERAGGMMVKGDTDILCGRKIPRQRKKLTEENDGKHVVFEDDPRK